MFKLNLNIPPSEKKINLKDHIYLIGSCFSDEIGNRLIEDKFCATSNPFGTIYNPSSIFKLLKNASKETSLIESHGVFYHWDCHGEVSGLSKLETTNTFKVKNDESIHSLKETNWLIITLGTAFVYRLKSSGEVVANCHKVPSTEFKKELLSKEEIIEDFNNTIDHLNKSNPYLNIILTVSPVRHVKDGLSENNLSKAILIQAVHEIINIHSDVQYFPSYEIIIDELRDYRFYKKDLIHPSNEAVDYVWNRFIETYLDDPSKEFLNEWKKIKSAIHHRPFQPTSSSHQSFILNTLKSLEKLNGLVDITVERDLLKKQLA